MPTGKTVLRLVVALALLGAYYLGPRLAGGGGGPVGNAGAADRIVFSNLPKGDDITLQRQGQTWTFADQPGLAVDRAVVASLLNSLDQATWKGSSRAFPGDFVTVTLQRGGKRTAIDLGTRLAPFTRQQVRVGGKVYEIDRDPGACLGIWEGAEPFGVANVMEPLLYNLGNDRITRLKFSNLFADYELQRSGDQQWRLLSGGGLEVHSDSVESAAERLGWITATGPATGAAAKQPFVRFVSFTTAGGDSYQYAVSKSYENQPPDRQAVVQLRQPSESTVWVNALTGRQCMPNAAMLFDGLPEAKLNTDNIVRLAGQRDGHTFILVRQGKDWKLQRPAVDIPFMKIEMGPGEPRIAAPQAFVDGLANIRSLDLFRPDSDRRRAMLDKAFEAAGAVLVVQMKDGSRHRYTVSSKSDLTDKVLLKADDRVLVVHENMDLNLVPNIEDWFEAKDLRGKKLQW